MSNMYGDQHRDLQDRFDTRKLADRLEEMIIKDAVDEMDKAFLESRDMFFLSTLDHRGRPTVSYKGGDPGFIRVVDPKTVAFPSYDGNGMFFSMGNIATTRHVGMLLIDFENPNRLRLQGEATLHPEDPLLAEYSEAELIVRVKVEQIWVNCPRYIHRYKKIEPSRNVPRPEAKAPLATWKRIDVMQDVLPGKDVGRPEEEGGLMTWDEYVEKLESGDV